MIRIEINPARVERIVFEASSQIEKDFDFAAWASIRELVDRIDRRLQRTVKAFSTRARRSRGGGRGDCDLR